MFKGTCCKVSISKNLSDVLPIQNGLKIGHSFIATAFSFYFRIFHEEYPRKLEMTGTECSMSDPGICW
jgi:hypothetical protein